MELSCRVQRQCRLLGILRSELALSSGLVKRLKWKNALFVNGQSAHTDRIVYPGDTVTVILDEQVEGFEPECLPLSILYEDEWLIALDKPSGQLVHPSPQRNDGTLANALLHHYRSTNQRCGVHLATRLDRDTFGVVLAAKSAHVHAKLCQLLRTGGVEKNYHAAVFGAPQLSSGVIELPVYKLGGGSLLRVVDERGQYAKTEYRVLQRFEKTALLQLHPITGRTHQLRLHCLAGGFPILGDPQYATPDSTLFSDGYGLKTQQLCAVQLRLMHPMRGEPLILQSQQHVTLPEVESRAPCMTEPE